MQITLNQDEIELAIDTYVRSQINIADTQELTIDLKATRGEGGFTANLEIKPRPDVATAPKPVTAVKIAEVVKAEAETVTVGGEAISSEDDEAEEDEAPAPVAKSSIFAKARG